LRVRPGCRGAPVTAVRRESRTRTLLGICIFCSGLVLLSVVAPAAGATAGSDRIAPAPAPTLSLTPHDDARVDRRTGPAIYAAPVDEEEELEGGDEEEAFRPGPDPCLAPQARHGSLSPLAFRCPGQSWASDAGGFPSSMLNAAPLAVSADAACHALDTSVQILR
jgi:hypothetical protein